MLFLPRQPCNDSIERFVKTLNLSGLLSQDEIAIALTDYCEANKGTVHSAETVCGFLIQKGIITSWQAGMLKDHRYKGFHIDRYTLREHVRALDSFGLYGAWDRVACKRVLIAVQHSCVTRVRGLVLYKVLDFAFETPIQIDNWEHFVIK